MAKDRFVVGVDFGTLSGRAVVVRVSDGEEVGAAEHPYRHGVVESTLPATGEPLPPDWALQVPGDYLDVLRHAVPKAVAESGCRPEDVVGIATDFTACTVLPVAEDGTPLCEIPPFDRRPHAYVKLWKHHAAQPEADQITAVARERGEPWLGRYGGRISSEWELAKGLQILHEDPEIYERMSLFVEAADWIVWRLCGHYLRNACTAGYKGQFQDGHYPDREYFAALHPRFADFAESKLRGPIGRLGAAAGTLTPEAARWTGLAPTTTVAVGNVDAHATAAAANTLQSGQMVAIMGTSTCHIMNWDRLVEIPGICGVVWEGVVPGMWGYEAGQSGVGDIFRWFVETHLPPEYHAAAERQNLSPYDYLASLAARKPAGSNGLVALDWHNGNRSVLVDHELSGVLVGLTLSTRPEDVYRAYVEATAFGMKVILDTFAEYGLGVRELVAAGGLSKEPFIMQIYADVLDMPISILEATNGSALGAAIHAAVAAGEYPNIYEAAEAMNKTRRDVYRPRPTEAAVYRERYHDYLLLHDYFGREKREVLRALRRARHVGDVSRDTQ